MANKSRLHIPKPTARPGDEPDFGYLNLSPAGSVDKLLLTGKEGVTLRADLDPD